MLYNASRRLGDTATAGEPAARGDIYMFTYTTHGHAPPLTTDAPELGTA